MILFNQLLFGFVLSALIFICASELSSLYTDDDYVHQLNHTNFDQIVSGKNHAWIIQFYMSWCGHCMRFAPMFKEFAKDVKTWRSVIDVGVINCNEAENNKICRDHGVESYPTMKLFWLNVTPSDKGEAMNIPQRDIPTIEDAMIKFLETNWNKGAPSNWPSLQPVQETNLKSLADSISGDSVYLFIEKSNSTVGSKIILDLSDQKTHVVRRVLSSSNLLNELRDVVSEDSLPALVKIFKDLSKEQKLSFSKADNDTTIRDKVFTEITGEQRNKEDDIDEQITTTTTVAPIEEKLIFIHLVDLENALNNSLFTEVGVVNELGTEQISALKAYLGKIKKYFPGTKPVMRYITKLYSWLARRIVSVSGAEFIEQLKKFQTKDAYLPEMRDYAKCKGSKPQYRGYPCSLWSLFHWLTVQADKEKNFYPNGVDDGGETLFVIRDYVKYFFTCQGCKKHFLEMAENVENEVDSSTSAVFWLWEAHNKVNKRLHGDDTEDPVYPKIQFPSQKACPKCWADSGWDKTGVLHFLHQFYSKPALIGSENILEGETNSGMVNSFKNVSVSATWTFQWFTSTDISLCVSLYVVSALLLVIIFLLFRQRRRKKRYQLGKYFALPVVGR